MRTTTTLENVINTVYDESADHYDQTVPVTDMEFDSLNHMWVSGMPVSVAPSAQRLISNRLRVPHAYLDRCPEDLQARNLNYWIEQEAKKRKALFCRFNGDTLRAVFTERYIPTDNLSVLARMLDYGFDPATEVQFTMDTEMMALKVPEYGRAFMLSEKDKIVPGISISNSEVGVLALSIEAFYYRLVCTNGLVAKTAVDARYKHISSRVMDEFPMILEGVISQSRHGHDRFRISAESSVDNPESTINAFARQFQIPQEQAQIVHKAFHVEPGATMYWVIQAFTRAAQDRSLSATDSYRLERAGGAILGMVKS